jgi:hypothetical protein
MAEDQGKRQRPPYASAGDLQAFFERMSNMQEPTLVDNDWVESFNLAAAQPSAIVSVLKWLKIVDQKGASLGIWDEVRIPSSRQAKLKELVRGSYKEIFDQFEDISKATMDDLRGAFIRSYKSGDPGRPITCFIALCKLAGIPISAQPKTRGRKAGNGEKAASPKRTGTKEPRTVSAASKSQATGTKRGATSPQQQQGVTISVNVEIPAEWSEEQIRDRLEAVRRATGQGGVADGS